MLKAVFVLEIFTFFAVSGYVEKQLDKKIIINFKICDVTDWESNNCNTHTAQYLKS